MNPSIPRNEYPRPQCKRQDWLCLNGTWDFEIDKSDSGLERSLLNSKLNSEITIPFCPECELSGINNVDFLNAVWYRREVTIPATWEGQIPLLHFQAIDYDATVWVNGIEVARHRGGWCGFTCNLQKVAKAGETITIVVRARDNTKELMPRGKQSAEYAPHAAEYHRTTGIWQTVWMEPVPTSYLERPWLTPDTNEGAINLRQPVRFAQEGMTVHATLIDDNQVIAEGDVQTDQSMHAFINLPIPADNQRYWSPEDPHLYQVLIQLKDQDGQLIDQIQSYTALRSIAIQGQNVLLNGKPVFQRLVLDQGFYPDGLLTAPSDQALVDDIQISLDAGFNGARLHQKVFEERFLYHADRMGYLCWGEFGDWGIDRINPPASYITQWIEIIQRDYSHPCLIGWCGLNETWHVPIKDTISGLDDLTRGMYYAAKAIDPTRPVIDSSGGAHLVNEADIYDTHDYEQDPEKFANNYSNLSENKPFINKPENENDAWSLPYDGQPFFVSEFGGTWWCESADESSWGYGQQPKTIEEVYHRIESMCSSLLKHPNMFGYCFTQLTDVFQEKNGLYDFNRNPKFDMQRISNTQKQPAAIETANQPETVKS
ncbi:glycoside hydrolase family 2 protein [Poriferisphaera sp. WC338]|uniref:glycoside hydrolase family 2 protein n=1 Tax=Poriferisphaera sp. WC338 TaxID=3425129 RepID=UPI003D813130